MYDDIGDEFTLTRSAERIVSLVPSLTESIASASRSLLVGATDWCTHPSDLDVARVRGTKNPDVDAVVALRPDVVIANSEENRGEDIRRLRERGVAVWVTAPTTVPEALTSLGRMYDALLLEHPGWLAAAAREWAPASPPPSRQAVVPIWRRPWMALGRDTFAGDVLARLGVRNVLDGGSERYPRIDLDRLPPHDLVVLPDEPYPFDETDGPEAFPAVPSACVSGRHLTWYGPSLVEARRLLTEQLAAAEMGR